MTGGVKVHLAMTGLGDSILANQAPLSSLLLAVGPGLKTPKSGGSHEYVISTELMGAIKPPPPGCDL